jgi:hypothetical protein
VVNTLASSCELANKLYHSSHGMMRLGIALTIVIASTPKWKRQTTLWALSPSRVPRRRRKRRRGKERTRMGLLVRWMTERRALRRRCPSGVKQRLMSPLVSKAMLPPGHDPLNDEYARSGDGAEHGTGAKGARDARQQTGSVLARERCGRPAPACRRHHREQNLDDHYVTLLTYLE